MTNKSLLSETPGFTIRSAQAHITFLAPSGHYRGVRNDIVRKEAMLIFPWGLLI
jgi:hypothetical protein